MEPCDPTYVFIDMLAQAAVLVLFTALKSMPEDTGTYHDICREYEKKAFKAAERIHSLAQKLFTPGLLQGQNPFLRAH